jgi:mutator protein MutT
MTVDGHPPAEIVVAFVARGDRFLVTRREGDPALAATAAGEVWELPGGKVAHGEGHRAALAREVREETGLEVEVGELICALCHAYEDRRVALHAYLCAPAHDPRTGDPGPGTADPLGHDRDRVRWVTSGDCRALAIPAANPPLLDALDWLRR